MLNKLILILLALLLIFTPVAFGSMELWAFSLMELGILAILLLGTVQSLARKTPGSLETNAIRNPKSVIPIVFLGLFLLFILLQIPPLPSGLLKILSPKTYAFRLELSPLSFQPSALSFANVQSTIRNPQSPISFVPFATQVEFFKWFTLICLFLFLLKWRPLDTKKGNLILIVMFVGIAESLYGMVEFFSGHRHILHEEAPSLVSAVTGTFVNRNYFAGYLLMVIPSAIGYIFYREFPHGSPALTWRRRLASIDGKTYFLVFGVILMILGLLFSASRMGIASLLLSFSLVAFFFRDPRKRQRISKTPVLILGLALLWAAWIGFDSVISRFFDVTDDFGIRWEMWGNTLQIVRDFPLFGSGLGTFEYVFPPYRSIHLEGIASHAENDFLQLVSEVGLIGAGVLLVPFLFLLRRAFAGIRNLSFEDPKRYIAIGGMVGILGLMFHSIVERNIQVPANAFLFTFLLAIILRIGFVGRKNEVEL
jgi:O-antigen ligase